MPDLRGMSARDAMRTLVKLGLTAHLTGDGFVVSQDPAPGAILEEGGCRLWLDRAASGTVANAGEP
jgi:beta-lactam-binding protein with PASTA domain